ncbi:MAG: hypothetical protein AB7T06_19815 [Kofleriaceae bacterium]
MELVIAAVLAGLSSVAVAAWYRGDARRTRRVLRRARVVRIADLVDGRLACIVGRVEADAEPITSMMSQVPCVAFDTTTSSLGNAGTVIVSTTRRAVPFFIVDESGRARIDAPQLALCNKPSSRSDRFEERVLHVGSRVRLVGSVSLDPAMQATAEHAYREGGFKATIVGTAKYPLLADVEDG